MTRNTKSKQKAKAVRRAARQVIGEPSRGRKRGPHGDGRRPFPEDPDNAYGLYDDDIAELPDELC